MNTVFDIATWILLASLCLVVVRVIRGPSLADRAIAADQAALHGVAIIVIYSAQLNSPILLDILIVTAIAGYMTIGVIGIFIERSARGKTRRKTEDTTL